MTVLIDPPLWPAHGRRWSHLVSDLSLAELHAFAQRLGIPERGFEGDHYDVPEERYPDAVRAGALPVSSRELLRRLQGSGLRRPKRRGERVLASSPDLDGLRVDTVQSTRPPLGPVDTVIVAFRSAGDLLVLPDGQGYTLPGAPVAERTPDAVRPAASALLGELLGGRPSGVPAQLGYLRTVPSAPSGPGARPDLVPVRLAVVLRWPVDDVAHRTVPRPPASWGAADQAVALLPARLSPLLRGAVTR